MTLMLGDKPLNAADAALDEAEGDPGELLQESALSLEELLGDGARSLRPRLCESLSPRAQRRGRRRSLRTTWRRRTPTPRATRASRSW